MFAARRFAAAVPKTPVRGFRTTAPAFVQKGDAVPDIQLVEGSPGNKVSLGQELQGKGLIIGVPGAFSPACSESHVPGYLNYKGLKDAGKVFVVSVNDPFVMKAWGTALDPQSKSGVRFLADPQGEFTKALDLDFESTAVFGQPRSKRYALKIEGGKVKEAHVEPDNTSVNVSAVEKVLG
ncbi:hypothetical protein MBLNU230_g0952t1 [Neophaeotheca triangularis]